MKKYIKLIGLLFPLLIPSYTIADILTLKDGTKLTGVVILEDAKHLVVETRFGSMSITRKSVANLQRDNNEKNLVLRGDFSVMRKDFNTAMEYYSEALTLYPSSKEVREKYRKVREAIDKSEQRELVDFGKQDEKSVLSITDENQEVAQAQVKAKKKEQISTLILYGFGAYPAGGIKSNREKEAIQAGKQDALKKAFGDAVGIGFTLLKGKVKIFVPGELPNYKIKIVEKQKVEKLGYAIKLQVQAHPSALLFSVPEELAIHETLGNVFITDNKKDNKTFAINEAYRQAVLNAVATDMVTRNKTELSGRIFLMEPPSSNIISGFYQVKIRVKVWLQPE